MEDSKSWAKFPNRSLSLAESQVTDEGLFFKDFKLTFYVDDAHCQIFAEKESDFFSISLTNREIDQLSATFVSSALELVDLIQTATKGQDPNLMMDLSEDGVITFSITILLGNKTRKLNFDIQLQREEPGSIASCKRLFSQMSREKLSDEGLMKMIASLISFNGTLEKNFLDSQKAVSQAVQVINELKEKDDKTQAQLTQQNFILEKSQAEQKEAQDQIGVLQRKVNIMESQLKEAHLSIEELKKNEALIKAHLEEVKISETQSQEKLKDLNEKLTEIQTMLTTQNTS